MAETDKLNINLRLNSISELSFSLSLDEFADSPIEYEVGFGFNARPNKESNSLIISTGVALRTHDKTFLKCWYSFEFNIQEFDDIVELSDTEFKCKGDILPSLLGISFSTLRGILYTKTLGTKISPVILPVINPHDLISKQMGQGK